MPVRDVENDVHVNPLDTPVALRPRLTTCRSAAVLLLGQMPLSEGATTMRRRIDEAVANQTVLRRMRGGIPTFNRQDDMKLENNGRSRCYQQKSGARTFLRRSLPLSHLPSVANYMLGFYTIVH